MLGLSTEQRSRHSKIPLVKCQVHIIIICDSSCSCHHYQQDLAFSSSIYASLFILPTTKLASLPSSLSLGWTIQFKIRIRTFFHCKKKKKKVLVIILLGLTNVNFYHSRNRKFSNSVICLLGVTNASGVRIASTHCFQASNMVSLSTRQVEIYQTCLGRENLAHGEHQKTKRTSTDCENTSRNDSYRCWTQEAKYIASGHSGKVT